MVLDTQTFEKIKALAEQVATREGCWVYDVEFVGTASGRTLRVFIDREGDSSVTVEDCSNVSNGLNLLLDVEDIVPGGAYNLEISSPGLERHLREPKHFEGALGELIFLRTRGAFSDYNPEQSESLGLRKQGQAWLKAVDGSDLMIDLEGAEIKVPMSEIEKSNVVFVAENTEGPKKPKGKKASKKRKSKKR